MQKELGIRQGFPINVIRHLVCLSEQISCRAINWLFPLNTGCNDTGVLPDFGLHKLVGKAALVRANITFGAQKDALAIGIAARDLMLGRDHDNSGHCSKGQATGKTFDWLFSRCPFGKMGDTQQGTALRCGKVCQRLQTAPDFGILMAIPCNR